MTSVEIKINLNLNLTVTYSTIESVPQPLKREVDPKKQNNSGESGENLFVLFLAVVLEMQCKLSSIT